MQLTDLHIERFGTLSNVSFRNLSDRMTVIWGQPGCGKTTLVHFLRDMFFSRNRASSPFLKTGVPSGGWLRLAWRSDEEVGGRSAMSGSPSSDRRTRAQFLQRISQTGGEEFFRVAEVPHDSATLPWSSESWSPDSVFAAPIHDSAHLSSSWIRELSGTRDASVPGYSVGRSATQDCHFPDWVNRDVFADIFTIGHEESERFDLLVRLCVEGPSSGTIPDNDLQSAESALVQVLRERDGDHSHSGISERIQELRRRQTQLQQDLLALRTPSPDIHERIRIVTLEIEKLNNDISRIDRRLREIETEIARLEALAADLRRVNLLPLDRETIEHQIRLLTVRLERWTAIRQSIIRDSDSGRAFSLQEADQSADTIISVRAIVSRLEERILALAAQSGVSASTEADRQRDRTTIQHLQQEIAALCRYLNQHEQTLEIRDQSLEFILAERCLSGASQLEHLMKERIASLQSELSRANDVLSQQLLLESDEACSSAIHRTSWNASAGSGNGLRTLQEVLAEIGRLQAERTQLVAERGRHEETLHARRFLLERLRQELQSAATLEQIDELKSRIAECDARIVMLEDRRGHLNQSEKSLRELIDRLRQRQSPRVMELASDYLRQLTDNECQEIRIFEPVTRTVAVRMQNHADLLTIPQLSRGTRQMLALALRLAIIRVRSETSVAIPLVIDDVFISSDDRRGAAVAQVLAEFATQGHQVIYLTSQTEVRELLKRYSSDVRSFAPAVIPAPIPVPEPTPIPVPPAPRIHITPPAPVIVREPTVASPTSTTNWLFYLEVDHGVEDLAGISLGELDAFRAAGINLVSDLLQKTPIELTQLTALRGYHVTAERFEALQGQAEMTCRVPMLRRSDASLLYAAGIRSVEELRQLRPEVLYDRIVDFQRTEAGSRFRRSGRLIDRQQAINWARFSQHSRPLADAMSSMSRFSSERTAKRLPSGSERSGQQRQQRREAMRTAGPVTRKRPRVTLSTDANERRLRRLARRRRMAAGLRTHAHPQLHNRGMNDAAAGSEQIRTKEEPVSTAMVGGRQLRFFLSRNSDVEAAPSIGPRTAENFYRIGVKTVGDLLNMGSDRLAAELRQKRITPTVIRQWQAQARLMCLVPELRGHDVQLLVACGISDPEDLAARKPADLLRIVAPFAETREGERILRNGRKPDLAEVTDWIQWAASAGSFRAA